MRKWKYILRPLLVVVLYFAIGFLAMKVSGNSVMSTVVLDCLVIGAYGSWVVVHGEEKPFRTDVSTSLSFILLFPVIWLFGQLAAAWVVSTFGAGGYETYSSVMSEHAVAAVVLSIGIAPVAEEILVRRVCFAEWRKYMNPWLALVLQAVLFSLLHGTWVHVIPTFVFAIFQGVLYARSNRLSLCMVTHFIYNSASVLFGGFAVPELMGEPYVFFPILGMAVVACAWLYGSGSNRKEVSDGTEEEAYDKPGASS